MVSAISFGWFNACPNRFILTNGKHPKAQFLGVSSPDSFLPDHSALPCLHTWLKGEPARGQLVPIYTPGRREALWELGSTQ